MTTEHRKLAISLYRSIAIPQRGIWTVRVIITPAAGQSIVLDAPIIIER